MLRERGLGLILSLGAMCWLAPSAALAAPPGQWSLGVERLFGFSRVSVDVDTGGGRESTTTTTSFSLFSTISGQRGYSSPRVALDFLSSSGVTFGGAVAYESIGGDSPDQDLWLFAARLGYFARPSADIGLWPRAGVTHVTVDFGAASASATAITLEVPLVFLAASRVGLVLLPHADIGVGGSTPGGADRTVTEVGFQVGANVFF